MDVIFYKKYIKNKIINIVNFARCMDNLQNKWKKYYWNPDNMMGFSIVKNNFENTIKI